MTPEKPSLTRRQFLKLCSLGALAAALPGVSPGNALTPITKLKLGRVAQEGLPVFAEPSLHAHHLYNLKFDQVIPILETVRQHKGSSQAEIWYQLAEDEFVHSVFIQLVENHRNVNREPIPEQGSLGEITVPAIDVYVQPRGQKTRRRYYFGATFWIKQRVLDEYGVPWYELPDEINGLPYFVRAYAVHLISPEEIAPLSPQVPPEQKRILVDLRAQRMFAFEAEREVFSTLISAGLPATFTPTGTFITNRKRPSRRMVLHTGSPSTDYDYPGVPWVCYLTLNGIAFHGAYWHAHWGQPMSHGCIEMTPEDAKWVYRWTTPVVPFHERYHVAETGTHVDVVSGF